MSGTNSRQYCFAAFLLGVGLIVGNLLTNTARAQYDDRVIGTPTLVPQFVPTPRPYIPNFSTPSELRNRGVNPMNEFGYYTPTWHYRAYRIGDYDQWGYLHTNADLGYQGPIYPLWHIYQFPALYDDRFR
jgi:hypothetical protein